MRIIACIEDPVVIQKILAHLDAKAPEPPKPWADAVPSATEAGQFDETG